MIEVNKEVFCPYQQSGIIPCIKGSFEFAIINNALFMQGGVAIKLGTTLLKFSKASYKVLDTLNISNFSNHTTYYLFIQETPLEEARNSDIISQVELEHGQHFCISSQLSDEAFLLGQIEVDYENAKEQGVGTISVSHNAFSPQKNEIDTRNTRRMHMVHCISDTESESISTIVVELSKALLQYTEVTSHTVLSVPCSAFFAFSQEITHSEYMPSQLFRSLQVHIRLLTWVHSDIWGKSVQDIIDKLEKLTQFPWQHSASYYRLDLDQKEGYFAQVFSLLQEMTSQLYLAVPQRNFDVHKSTTPQENIDTIVEDFGNISHKEILDEDGLSTILLGGSNSNVVQVGRGTQSGNDIILGENDKTVSRTHIKITRYKQGFFIEDLSSMGTYVDGIEIKKNKKKFVTVKNVIILGKKGCSLDLNHATIQALQKQ